jgi:hypothetical protein
LRKIAVPAWLLELAQLGAHRRGRAADPVGRLGEAAELHAGHEAAQDIEVEGRPPHRIVLIHRTVGSKLPDFRNENAPPCLAGQAH